MNINNLKNKYQELSLPVKASIWYTICNIFNKGIALFSTPVFTRILTEEQYGTFAIFQSWFSILLIFTSMNIFLGGYQKGILLFKDDIDAFTSTQLSLTTFITAIYFIIYLINTKFWNELFQLSTVLMLLMFMELMMVPALEFWSAKQRFDFEYKKYIIVTVIISIMSVGLGVIAILLTQYKTEARVATDVFAKVLVSLILYIHIFSKGKKIIDLNYWKYAIAFNVPLIPHYISNYILSQSDRIMIGKMVGNSQAAFYSVAYTIATMMLLITNAINNSLTPYIYKKIDDGKTEDINKSIIPLVIMVAMLCVVAMAFAPEIIVIFAGKNYLDAIYVIPPISISVYFIFLYSLYSNIEYFYQKTKAIALATSVSAVVNIILNYIFINIFGYYAAGYTTLVCYILLSIMHYVFYKKTLKIEGTITSSIYNDKMIVIVSICLLLIMFIMTLSYNNAIARYMIITAILVMIFIKRYKILDIVRIMKK